MSGPVVRVIVNVDGVTMAEQDIRVPPVPASGTAVDDEEIWTTEDVVRACRVDESTVRDWRATRGLPAKKIGRVVLFRRSEVLAWLDRFTETQEWADAAD